jgi:hypothetical protein
MRHRSAASLAVLVVLGMSIAPGCGETVIAVLEPAGGPGSDGGPLDDGGPIEGSTDGPVEGEPPTCPDRLGLNAPCASAEQCCSGYCTTGPNLETTCRPATGCLGAGSDCARAGACCSVGCFVDQGAPRCAASDRCHPVGAGCSAPHECCSNSCSAGKCAAAGPGCRPAGESCAVEDECCGGVCEVLEGETPVSVCRLIQACRPQGETCSVASDCCSGRCAADTTGVMRCASLAECKPLTPEMCTSQVGDLCKDAKACCSRLCVPTGDGVKRCAAAGGCRSQCERCEGNSDCCSGSCVPDATGTKRCRSEPACGKPGELCDKDPDCCGPGGKCVEDPPHSHVKRCHAPGPPVCKAEGAPCALASECCAGRCIPREDGGYACRKACGQVGSLCTTRADCCGSDVDCLVIGDRRACAVVVR